MAKDENGNIIIDFLGEGNLRWRSMEGGAYFAEEMALPVVDAFVEELREPVTAGARVITTDHASIHLAWGYSFYVQFDDVADAATRNIVITAPDSEAERPYIHLKFYDAWISNASGVLRLYEDPYEVTGGTAVGAVNRNRVSPGASAATVVHTATVTLDSEDPEHAAVLLETLYFGGGGTGPQGRSGGDRSIDIEWVLDPGQTYVFTITNTSGAAADIGFWAFWYEEPAQALGGE
jgi:hypothetical protein